MSYPGGKAGSGVYQQIINQQPPHDVYIEAFLGNGAVLRAKRPASTNIGIDVDPLVTETWRDGYTKVLNCNAIEYLRNKRDWTGRELVYCDPPYLMESRKIHRRIYRYEMDTEEHELLLETLTSLPCMVQLSGYFSILYAYHLKGWRHMTFQSMTRGGPATEHLWMNYPEPKALHTYKYLGSDYRERERIKRMADRWVAKIGRLPELERLALKSALLTADTANSHYARGPADTAIPDDDAGDTVSSSVIRGTAPTQLEVV